MDLSEEQLQAENPAQPVCANCGAVLYIVPSKTPLCETCREAFIKYPIPTWIKAFGIGILAVLVFSIFSITKTLQTGIHYERGMKAYKQRNYLTAQREFAKVVEKEKDYKEAKCRLLISAYHNDDFKTVGSVFNELRDEQFEVNSLFNEVNHVIEQASYNFPGDSFLVLLAKYGMSAENIPEEEYTDFLKKNTNDVFAFCGYASFLEDKKRHSEADSLLSEALSVAPDNYRALSLKIPVKREMQQLDSAYYYADYLLNMNHENLFAMASKVRILLKEKKDDEALALAKKCMSYRTDDAYTLCSVALAYHYNKDSKSRDAILTSVAKDSTSAPALGYIKDIINGKEKFRD